MVILVIFQNLCFTW